MKSGTGVAIYCDLCMCQEFTCIISFNPYSPLRQLHYEAGIIMNYVVWICNVPCKYKELLVHVLLFACQGILAHLSSKVSG